ncbi:zinc finger protein ZAT9-like [Lycium ferocissimum]|uniref:zinc finger protein ZAT9-like n=1 Tax=Lycium ferocissimum TaxID=112874 RepID=UPI0028168B29|nr:zinc finger protein ZAT9-like [Lycium ferocissimum]
MEKHKTCKLCSRKFANGRALGGHMRSHMMNLHTQQQEQEQEKQINQQISDETDSIPSSSWLSEEEKGKILNSCEGAADDSVVVLPDKESETESSKNPTRSKRSKRVRKSRKLNFVKITDYSSLVEPEPVSSISETSPEEDVAHCLMMLSRDKWITKQEVDDYSDEEEDNSEDSGEQVKIITKTKGRGKYICETCNKVFKSYQALGGHRASHKKIKVASVNNNNEVVESGNVVVEEKIHECPVCYRVFSSGQALGGHKRTHVIGVAATNVSVPVAAKIEFSRTGGTSLIDLNLPPPMEDDDEIISQVEVSAISDVEFVNPNKNQR